MAYAYDKILDDLQSGGIAKRAAAIGYEYGQIDGGHHKQWVIDQMLRILLGAEYPDAIEAFKADGAYDYDEGIAP